MTGAPTTTDNRTLSVSDEDIRILCAVVFLCLPSPILMATLGARLKDTLNAYPQESSRTHLVSRIFGFGQPKPASKKLLSSWLRRFSNIFEIRPVSGQDERTVKMCGLAIMDEEYWRQDPSSPTKDRLFELPELSVRAKADGQVESIERDGLYFRVLLIHPAGVVQEHIIPIIFQLRIQEGAFVKKGEALITSMVILPRAASSDDSTEKFRQVSFDPKDNIKYPEAAVSREEDQDAEAEYPPATIPENRDEIITDEPRTIESPTIGPNLGELLDGIFSTNPVNEDKEPQHDVSGKESAKQQPLEPTQENVERAKASVLEERQAAEQAKADAEKDKAAALEERRVAEQAKADAEKAKAARRQEAAQKAAAAIKAVTEEAERQAKEESERQAKEESELQAKAEEPEAEKAALIDFWKALNTAGWRYSLRDVVRFHTSVRCEPLTVLGGAPGSGKSSLARLYADYFGLGNPKRFLSVDVQPSWHDRMDFLGFVKTHGDKHVFVDAETGVARFLRDAAKNNTGLWLACLEEINLARPEHYFADFLQRISLDDSIRWKRPISFWGNSNDEQSKEPLESFYLSQCLRFVGTCNFDETTQSFSARFLDRCNYIELQSVPLQTLFFPKENAGSEITFPNPEWTWRPFSSSSRTRMDDRKEEVQQLLDKIAPKGENHKGILQKLGISPSPRVVKDIIRYVEARLDTTREEIEDDNKAGISNSADDLFSRALDEALLQRILPQLIVVQSGFPNSETDDLRKDLKDTLSPASNDLKLHLCKRFLEKIKSI